MLVTFGFGPRILKMPWKIDFQLMVILWSFFIIWPTCVVPTTYCAVVTIFFLQIGPILFPVFEQFKPLWRDNHALHRRTEQSQYWTHCLFYWRWRPRSSWRRRARTAWCVRACSSWRRRDGGRHGDAGIGTNRVKHLSFGLYSYQCGL